MVDHEIRAGRDEVDFRVVATNPTGVESQAQWAQPCIRVDRYAGTKAERTSEAYLPRCFLYVDGKPVRMPTTPWARTALYTPGQVWCPEGVSRDDVNPRPFSSIVPSNGLIGCVSADGKELLATAWEPYQELFQGVIVCLHSDFRIGGLKPGESKTIRGKIYLMPADFPALQARYRTRLPRAGAPGPARRGRRRRRRSSSSSAGTSPARASCAGTSPSSKRRRSTAASSMSMRAHARGAPASFTWLCWGRRAFTADELEPARDDLESIAGRDAVPPQLPPVQRDARRPRLVRRPRGRGRPTPGWPPSSPARAAARASCWIPSSTRGSSSTTASSATPDGAPGPSTPRRPAAAAAR